METRTDDQHRDAQAASEPQATPQERPDEQQQKPAEPEAEAKQAPEKPTDQEKIETRARATLAPVRFADLPEREAPKPETTLESDANLSFDHSIVVDIAHREASKMGGVIEMSGGFMDGWMKSRSRGIKVEEIGQAGESAYSLRLNVIVEFGTNCPDLCKKLRERIAKSVLHHTGRPARRIHIHVAGIKDPPQRDEHEDEEPFAEEHGIGF
jgi:uncharacterized alkaline shock family protein YloU